MAIVGEFFHFVMIKPSHYDDDGYPIQWVRSAIPSNTLACLNGLAEDAQRRAVLGAGVTIRLHTYDETNRRVRPDRIIREIRRAGGKALIALVGVQSNQFPRAVDLARPFLAAGLPVAIGGFHISGCLAMLPEMPPEMRDAQALGITFFAGEAEDRPARHGAARCLERHAGAAVQLHGRPAVAGGRAAADFAAPARPPHVRFAVQHRSRPRLSVSVFVLHHHQRAGPQEPLSLAG